MKLSTRLSTCLFGITSALTVVLSNSIALALTPEEIDAVASQTTVVIAQGLEKSTIQTRQPLSKQGSGVIIGRQGNTYYVLTAYHNVSITDTKYGIRTWDGVVHPVEEVDIERFGNFQGFQSQDLKKNRVRGFDLAIIKFECNREYQIASLKVTEQISPGDTVFISGWPKDQNPQRYRKFEDGFLSLVNSNPDSDGGYSLLYSNKTSDGMSGGPVFDQDGWLIGIHGRGVAKPDSYCIDQKLSENNSCGIQVIHFLTTPEFEILINRTNLNENPVDSSIISNGIKHKEVADYIENIYEDFTFDFVESAINSQPSGTCWSLLIGEDFCNNECR